MIKKLYKSVTHELDYISDKLHDIEINIFEGQEKDMVLEISKTSRQLLNFKQATSLHKEVLESFDTASRQFFGPGFAYHLKTITGEYYKVRGEINSLIDAVGEIRETNNSLLSSKQNEIMKVLTIMAFVTFPLSVIASLFGMNTTTLPIVGLQNDFWIIMGIMGLTTIIFFLFFKYKDWL
jgi:magnesium transporter